MNIINFSNNFFGSHDFDYKKESKNNSLFYIATLQTENPYRRYIKIGTTEQTLRKRFSASDYKKYSYIRILFVIEVDTKFDCYQLEDLTKAYLRTKKGCTWIKNDRFTYFKPPEIIPLFANTNEKPIC